jgi:hypothetical protein
MENIEKVSSPTWVPDEEAILYARLRTTGINETRFVTQGYEWTRIPPQCNNSTATHDT